MRQRVDLTAAGRRLRYVARRRLCTSEGYPYKGVGQLFGLEEIPAMAIRERITFRTGDLWGWTTERAWRATVKLAETHQRVCAQSIFDEIRDRPNEPDLEGGTQVRARTAHHGCIFLIGPSTR
jgi:hypothetical protein